MIHKVHTFKLALFSIYIWLMLPNTAMAVDVMELLQRGQKAFEQGAFTQATQYWEIALTETSFSLQYIDLLVEIATAYQTINQFNKAYSWLQKAVLLAERQGSLAQQALIYSHLSQVLLAMQKPEEAETYLQKGDILLRATDESFARAHLQDSFGTLYFLQKDYPKALEHYQQAIELANAHGNLVLLTQNLIHQGWVYVKQGNIKAAIIVLKNASKQVRQQSSSYIKAKQLVNLGYLGLHIQSSSRSALAIYKIFEEAVSLAEQYQDTILLTSAIGYLGQAYEQIQRFDKALVLTEQAIQRSQGMENLLYHWIWQRGRLLQAQGDLTGAITAYKQALTYKQTLRYPRLADPINETDIFQTYIQPVYRCLLDVLFQQATHTHQNTALLKEGRDTLEQLAIATIKDHFREMPINDKHSLVNPIKHLEQGNAVLYLVSLPERIELLWVSQTGIFHETSPITEKTLRQTVHRFNQSIQEKAHTQFIEPATQLYQWLIAPFYRQLIQHQIDTLIIVPEGVLLTLPFAALFDNANQTFLIEQVALAITPSLNLTIPYASTPKQDSRVLLTGLAEVKKGYAELKTSLREVTEINTVLNTELLLDRNFTLENVQKTLQTKSWSTLHIASHCRISPEPMDTFVLTYEGAVGLNQLANLFREQNLELLTLSYCQVADDERAFLGLASLAFKVGIHSILSNLWFVDNDSTVKFMRAFYANLQQANINKAQALQRAQIELLKDPTFQHPYYWATFQLTGHWF